MLLFAVIANNAFRRNYAAERGDPVDRNCGSSRA